MRGILALVFGLMSQLCFAQAPEKIVSISLKAAMELAEKASYDTKLAESSTRMAHETVGIAAAKFWPTVSMSAGAEFSPYEVRAPLGSSNLELSATEILYEGGRTLDAYNAAKLGESEAKKLEGSTVMNVHLSVISEYYNLLLLRETIAYYNNVYAIVKPVAERLKRGYKRNAATRADYLAAALVAGNLATLISDTEFAAAIPLEKLRSLLGTKGLEPSSLSGTLTIDRVTHPNKEEYQRLIIKNNRDLQAYTDREESLRLQRHAAMAGHGPTIALSAGYGFRSEQATDLFNQSNRGGRLSIGLSMPLFDGAVETREKAVFTERQITLELQRARQRALLAESISGRVDQIGVAITEIERSSSNIANAREGWEFAQVQYGAGLLDLRVWIDARSSLTAAEINKLHATMLYLRSQAELAELSGFKIQ